MPYRTRLSTRAQAPYKIYCTLFISSSRMELRGPCTYIKTTDTFRNIKNPDILDACIELSGEVIPLQQNTVWIERFPESLYMSHCFQYHDNDGKALGGSWSSSNIPVDIFKTMRRIFRRQVTNENGESAIFRVVFTEKILEELRVIT